MPSESLDPTATTRDLLDALDGLGMYPAEIARAVGVSTQTIRAWRTKNVRPRLDAAIALDDLRATAHILLLADKLDPEQVGFWLRSRNLSLDFQRPLDMIATAPGRVRAAAVDAVGKL
jgi:transcriptional regulator with XRE-family HTH domain